jgi:hypothetical protein
MQAVHVLNGHAFAVLGFPDGVAVRQPDIRQAAFGVAVSLLHPSLLVNA